MKKRNFFIAASLFITFATNAQITITQSDMPTLNTTYTEITDTICASVSVGNAGASQTWNLTNIANHIQVTSSCVSPSTLPAASYFPTATAVITKPGSRDSYIKVSSTALEMLGLHGNFGNPMGVQAGVFTPPFKYYQFPTTYQTSFNGNYSFEIKVAVTYPSVDSMKMNYTVDYSSIVDGWGNVTTPVFTNVSCLRQKSTSYGTITSFAHNTITGWVTAGTPEKDTTIEYIWLSNQQKYALADITTDASGGILQASYLSATGTVGINENTSMSDKIAVFPNPANDIINISGVTQNSLLIIFDSNGKLVNNKLLKDYKNTLDISNYNNGIYFYHVVDLKGQTLDKGKFTVVK